MGNLSSNLSTLISRLLKGAVVACLVPVALGLLAATLAQLELVSLSGRLAKDWVQWGFGTYVGLHIVLYRPVALFRASHRLFAALAVWLFGGQVASVEASRGGGKGSKGGGKAGKTDAGPQGSALVAFSPYVMPSYALLVCVAGWALSWQWDRSVTGGPVCFLVGLLLAFHWLMTADELQQQRGRWHVETYLLAIGLIVILTLCLAAAALPLAVPEFSFAAALSDGFARARQLFLSVFRHLFL